MVTVSVSTPTTSSSHAEGVSQGSLAIAPARKELSRSRLLSTGAESKC